MKTVQQRIDEAMQDMADNPGGASEINQALCAVYWLGEHVGAKRVCDAAQNVFSAQRKRATAEHCCHVAARVLGNVTKIYDGDYSSDTPDWEWDFNIVESAPARAVAS